MFLVIYVIGYLIIFLNWSPEIRPEASSCLISIVHGTPVVFLASYAVLTDPNHGLAASNTNCQKLVLDYSIAYFLMDLVHYIVLFPSDVLFIGHQLGPLFVIFTCRYFVSHGAFAILFLLILAEVTSAFQNAWTLASTRRRDGEFAANLYDFLSPPFYALYSVVRGFAGPYFVYQMVVFFWGGLADGLIPRWLWIFWVAVVLTTIGVSILWISNLWIELYRESKKTRGES